MRRGRGCGRKVGQSKGRKEEVGILFTYEKKARALQSYEQTQSVWEMSKLIRLISNCHHIENSYDGSCLSYYMRKK